MSTPFQNRLVGTVIVAAILIIFLPDILDGNKAEYYAEFDPIPKAPKPLDIPVEKSFPSQKIEILYDEVAVDEVAIDDEANNTSINNTGKNDLTTTSQPLVKATTIDIQKTKIDSLNSADSKLPEKALSQTAWAVQLGSFRHEKNVKELIEKLKKAGYTAFTKPIKTQKGTLTKVFVGPELIKSKLEEKLPDLKRLTGMQGKVAYFSASK